MNTSLRTKHAEIKKTNDLGSGMITLIAQHQGNGIAYASYKKENCYLYSLAVNEKFRYQGIGTQLFHEAMKDLSEHGCKEMKWEALPNSVSFYEKQGASLAYGDRLWEELDRPVPMKITLYK